MSSPFPSGPTTDQIMQRLDLLERKIDWLARHAALTPPHSGPSAIVETSAETTAEASASQGELSTPHQPAPSYGIVPDDADAPDNPDDADSPFAPDPHAASSATSAAGQQYGRVSPSEAAESATDPAKPAEPIKADQPSAPTQPAAAFAPPSIPPAGRALPVPPAGLAHPPLQHPHPGFAPGWPAAYHYQPMRPDQRLAPPGGPVPPQWPVGRPPMPGAPPTTGPGVGAGATAAAPKPAWPWLERIIQEGKLGMFLLSGAAALLVIAAAVSLIALVWDSIPDLLKIGGLALLAGSLTAVGVALSITRPGQRVAAGTLTGTGGGLGFVAVIGAALLLPGVSAPLAMLLMAIWGVLLLIVSRLTRVLFTAVVSTIGALVTIMFAGAEASRQPQQAVVIWLLVLAYALVLALSGAILARGAPETRQAAWYPLTSIVATLAALALAPARHMLDASVGMSIAILLTLSALLIAQVLHSGLCLWRIGRRALTGWDWLATGLFLLAIDTMLITALRADHQEEAWAGLLVAIAILVMLVAVSVALTTLPAPEQWRRALAIAQQVVAPALGGAVVLAVGEPLLYPLLLLAVALCLMPALRFQCAEAHLVIPILGFGAVFLLFEGRSAAWLTILSILLAVLLSASLEGAARHTSPAAVGKSLASALRAAVIITAVNMVALIPLAVLLMIDASNHAFGLAQILPGVLLVSLALLGLFSPGATLLQVLGARLVGRRYGIDAAGRPLTGTGPTGGAVLSALLLKATGMLLLLIAPLQPLLVWKAAVVLVVAALGGCGSWMLAPWARRPGTSLIIAMSSSILVLGSVMTLTQTGPGSVVTSVVLLLIGAACIVVGFRQRLTPLRHYGLVLVLVAVLKLAVVDMGSQSSMDRVLSLAMAGAICFVLSLIYSRYSKEIGGPAPVPPVPAGGWGVNPAGPQGPGGPVPPGAQPPTAYTWPQPPPGRPPAMG